jgi:sulfate adenylyltransferase large subunit
MATTTTIDTATIDTAPFDTAVIDTATTDASRQTQTRTQTQMSITIDITTPPRRSHDLLRFATAGSVDDGKSTLIGRLLHDTKSLQDDTIEAVEISTKRRGGEGLDLALITDGLRAEREQGITIDVAHRYFSTARRSFVIADTPGHVQYTRNMVTGASTSDLAIILIDARHGLKEQSYRHASIAAMLGIKHLVFAVNKMDLVDWSTDRFHEIEVGVKDLATRLGLTDWVTIPLSALSGDNVVDRSEQTPWYAGPTLLEHLETVSFEPTSVTVGGRLSVQWIVRPSATGDTEAVGDPLGRRWYCGPASGQPFQVGDAVTVLPNGAQSSIAAVSGSGAATRIQLAHERDVSRGDTIALATDKGSLVSRPTVSNQVTAVVCAMSDEPITAGTRLLIKHGSRTTQAVVNEVISRLDIVSGADVDSPEALVLNEIGRVRFTTAQPLVSDSYLANPMTGCFIAISPATNATVLAAMIN